MRLRQYSPALLLIAALSARTAAQDESPNEKPVREPAPVEAAGPMASFARLVSGEWRTTLASGTSFRATWHWGPGRHSVRVADAVDVYYWHPGRQRVCLLALSPFARGVSEGTIEFEGETATGVFDLYQTSGLRKMGLRWAFAGPDEYHDTLLEATGPDGLKPMNEWHHVRSRTLTEPRSPATEKKPPNPSEHPVGKAFEPLLGHAWESKADGATARAAFPIRSTFEWIPDVDAVYARVLTPREDGEPIHLLDAYFFHHTGTHALRCLALSNQGGVYEGEWTVLEGGALQLDLKGYEGDQVVSRAVRFDFEKDGTPRHRVWSLEGSHRTLMLDGPLKKFEPKKD